MQFRIFASLFAIIFAVLLMMLVSSHFGWVLVIVLPLFVVGLYDVLQTKHAILRNYPVIGHFRFIFESIRPQIYQYFIESDTEGRPLQREQRDVIYKRSKGSISTQPYGTKKNVEDVGYEWINHSMLAKTATDYNPRVMVGNDQCRQPYKASILNISAMSFGAISKNAVLALNKGAKKGGFSHNTGEGGLSPYHLEGGGDIVWQIGTGYFGCRNHDGSFNAEKFKTKAANPSVKMIELKISQGAKAGHGGILPAAKITEEIAHIRDVPMGHDVVSPPRHSTFDTPIEMMQFIRQLRELSDGKPVGFKLCLGSRHEFMSIVKAIIETDIVPDFITVDGAEGGTGAAPLEFANSVGTPLNDGLVFVHNTLVGTNLRDKIRIICSGKLITGFQLAHKLALGADMLNSARAFMLSVGCVHSLKCNTNLCPTGVTSQNPRLVYGLKVEEKYHRVARYHAEAIKSLVEPVAAAGLNGPHELQSRHIYRRISATKVIRLDEIYHHIDYGSLLSGHAPDDYLHPWQESSAERF